MVNLEIKTRAKGFLIFLFFRGRCTEKKWGEELTGRSVAARLQTGRGGETYLWAKTNDRVGGQTKKQAHI